MIDLLPWVAMLVALAVFAYIGVPRIAGLWFTRSTWTLSEAELDSKFLGMIRFGLDGSFFALFPKSKHDIVSFTKSTTKEGASAIRVRIESHRLTSNCANEIQVRLDAQPGRIEWSKIATGNPQILEIEVSGPVASDASGMEGVARGVLASLGHDSTEKYRIESQGPNDEEKIAEYLSS